jgi:hypothetical protein
MKIQILLLKLARLTAGEWRDLFAAQWALVLAQSALWLRPRGSLVSPGLQDGGGESELPIDAALTRLAQAVDRAASFGPIRAQCLVRSIALARLMEARGYSGAAVRVGVVRNAERMLAHAWVEYNGAVIGDDAHRVGKFDQLPGIDVDF